MAIQTQNLEIPNRHTWRRHARHNDRTHRIIVGSLVIAFGAILLLRELQLIPRPFAVWELWPLLVIGAGLGQIVRKGGVFRALFGLAIVAFGIAFLLDNIGVLALGAIHYWPVLIVLLGAAIMLGHRNPRQVHFTADKSSADFLRRSVTFGGVQLKVDSQQFKGGDLSAVMGGIEVDMRGAAISGDEAVLTIYSMMGGIDLCIPENWKLVDEVTPTLGAVEDKTTAASSSDQERPRLVIRGSVIMGAVGVKN